MNQIAFKLEVFEGPLDLLLHLISKNKVSIYDIPISEITGQYLEYMSEMQRYDIELSSEFLLMAANLLYIKSKMILPGAEDELMEEDPRLELTERLALYKRIKQAADILRQREFEGRFMFFKPMEFITPLIIDESLKLVTPKDLEKSMQSVYQRIINRKPLKTAAFSKIVGREPVPVFSKVTSFLQRLKNFGRIKFREFFRGIKTRDEAVASFLAVLELIKMNKITVCDNSGEMEITYIKKRGKKKAGG